MFRSLNATAAMTCMILGLAGCVQQQAADPPPANCAEAAKQAWDNIGLRIQHDVGNTSRESARVHLYLAEQAAARNDEKECWRQYNWSKYLVR